MCLSKLTELYNNETQYQLCTLIINVPILYFLLFCKTTAALKKNAIKFFKNIFKTTLDFLTIYLQTFQNFEKRELITKVGDGRHIPENS